MKFTTKQVIIKHLQDTGTGRGAGKLYDMIPGLN